MAYQNDLRGRLLDAATRFPGLKAEIFIEGLPKSASGKLYCFGGEAIRLVKTNGRWDFDEAIGVFETLAQLFNPNDLGISHKEHPLAENRLLMAIIRQEKTKFAGYRWPDMSEKIITIRNIFKAAADLLPESSQIKPSGTAAISETTSESTDRIVYFKGFRDDIQKRNWDGIDPKEFSDMFDDLPPGCHEKFIRIVNQQLLLISQYPNPFRYEGLRQDLLSRGFLRGLDNLIDRLEGNLPADYTIIKRKSVWTFHYNRTDSMIPEKRKGLKLLEILLIHPNKEYYPTQLLREAEQPDTGTIQTATDDEYFENRLHNGDCVSIDEVEKIRERDRKSVQRALAYVFRQIDNRELRNHFEQCIQTGVILSYKPDSLIRWIIQ